VIGFGGVIGSKRYRDPRGPVDEIADLVVEWWTEKLEVHGNVRERGGKIVRSTGDVGSKAATPPKSYQFLATFMLHPLSRLLTRKSFKMSISLGWSEPGRWMWRSNRVR
jgi:hypothetical protein